MFALLGGAPSSCQVHLGRAVGFGYPTRLHVEHHDQGSQLSLRRGSLVHSSRSFAVPNHFLFPKKSLSMKMRITYSINGQRREIEEVTKSPFPAGL